MMFLIFFVVTHLLFKYNCLMAGSIVVLLLVLRIFTKAWR